MNTKPEVTSDNDDDLDALLAESLLEAEKRKNLKKIARDKINSRLLTEEQQELLRQEEALKWVDSYNIVHIETKICIVCAHSFSEILGFYKHQKRLNSPSTERLLSTPFSQDLHYKAYRTTVKLNYCTICKSFINSDRITSDELPILKGL